MLTAVSRLHFQTMRAGPRTMPQMRKLTQFAVSLIMLGAAKIVKAQGEWRVRDGW